MNAFLDMCRKVAPIIGSKGIQIIRSVVRFSLTMFLFSLFFYQLFLNFYFILFSPYHYFLFFFLLYLLLLLPSFYFHFFCSFFSITFLHSFLLFHLKFSCEDLGEEKQFNNFFIQQKSIYSHDSVVKSLLYKVGFSQESLNKFCILFHKCDW